MVGTTSFASQGLPCTKVYTQCKATRGKQTPAAKGPSCKVHATKAVCSFDETKENLFKAARTAGLGLALTAALFIPTAQFAEAFEAQPVYGEMARLTAGDPVKNAYALLRNALPINNKQIRQVQLALESISEDLRVPGVRFSGVSKSVETSLSVVSRQGDKILKDVAPSKKDEAKLLLADLKQGLEEFKIVVDNKDKQQVPILQQKLLTTVGLIEEAMMDGFPFEIPQEYASMPLLKGRATLELKVRYIDNPKVKSDTMTIVLDGLNAPVTAGNFMDLVQRKFYDKLEVDRSDGFVVQMGNPKGKEIGFVDPKTNKLRTIPLEVKVPGDKLPVYGETLEDIGRYNDVPALPFNAYGTLAMARSEFETNSASSQIFFLLKESELTPSGSNLLDGRYSVFGYVTINPDALGEMKVGDIIESIRVVDGLENLVNPTYDQRSAPPEQEPTQQEAIASIALEEVTL
eukprot:CAMPEP_0196579320 /NCGR_PEP_ID=MMETSP1081-20130531/20065_1 /TAXON_ID=36882 /ORGANISM="Pyramimonas amylifera, Strain CCMP720" /LENGTH=460 /DNA_ID=CAMNT_0041898857 /DNA_START=112 /DNA_END=1494 /DNA_ORIENTATION=+